MFVCYFVTSVYSVQFPFYILPYYSLPAWHYKRFTLPAKHPHRDNDIYWGGGGGKTICSISFSVPLPFLFHFSLAASPYFTFLRRPTGHCPNARLLKCNITNNLQGVRKIFRWCCSTPSTPASQGPGYRCYFVTSVYSVQFPFYILPYYSLPGTINVSHYRQNTHIEIMIYIGGGGGQNDMFYFFFGSPPLFVSFQSSGKPIYFTFLHRPTGHCPNVRLLKCNITNNLQGVRKIFRWCCSTPGIPASQGPGYRPLIYFLLQL